MVKLHQEQTLVLTAVFFYISQMLHYKKPELAARLAGPKSSTAESLENHQTNLMLNSLAFTNFNDLNLCI